MLLALIEVGGLINGLLLKISLPHSPKFDCLLSICFAAAVQLSGFVHTLTSRGVRGQDGVEALFVDHGPRGLILISYQHVAHQQLYIRSVRPSQPPQPNPTLKSWYRPGLWQNQCLNTTQDISF